MGNDLFDIMGEAMDNKGQSCAAKAGKNWQKLPNIYKYHKYIKTPKEIGMTTDGTMPALQKNVASLVDYGELLISGEGNASAVSGGLGNKYFIKTGGKCRVGGKEVDRYVYINNVPYGTVPFCENCAIKHNGYKGLIPGMLQNLEEINTSSIFKGFLERAVPECQYQKLETVKLNEKGEHVRNIQEHPIAISDIKTMNPCNWSEKNGKRQNPITRKFCPELPKRSSNLGTKLNFMGTPANLDQRAGGGECPPSIPKRPKLEFFKNIEYDNEILCAQLNKNPFARFYITAFTIGMIILLFKFIKK
jgi:hypothetical protein